MIFSLERLAESAVDAVLPDRPRVAVKRMVRRNWEKGQFGRADVAVIAHPKSGSTWLRFQLTRLYQRKHGLPESVIPNVEKLHALAPAIPQIYMAGYEYMKHLIAAEETDPRLTQKACIFLLRHPIDVTVSLYFHVLKHAQRERKLINDWPLDLTGTSIMEFAATSHWGLQEVIGFYNSALRHAARLPRAHVVRYEDMLTRNVEALTGMARFIGHPVDDADIAEAVEFTSFERMREAEMKNTFNTPRLHAANPKDADSFKVRRAKQKGYRDYFSGEQAAALEAIVKDRLDPRAGY